jgi:WD40 repeat protein
VTGGIPFHYLLGTRQQYARAILQALATVVFFTCVIGLRFIPSQIHRSLAPHSISVLDCQEGATDQQVFMLIKRIPADESGAKQQLASYSLRSGVLEKMDVTATTWPECFAVGEDGRAVYVASADDGSIIRISSEYPSESCIIGRHLQGTAHVLALADDEKTLISLGHRGLYAWDVPRRRPLWCRFNETADAMAILPGSDSIICYLSEQATGRLEEIDAKTGTTIQVVKRDLSEVHHLTASPDGKYVAGVGGFSGILLLEHDLHHQAWKSRRLGASLVGMSTARISFSPDSARLVSANDDGRGFLVWDLASMTVAREIASDSNSLALGSVFLTNETLLCWSETGVIRRYELSENGIAATARGTDEDWAVSW